MAFFARGGVETSIPLEQHELLHRYLQLNPEKFPNAERIARTTLSLPVYPAMADHDVETVAQLLAQAGSV